jgi:hypothetical protein
MELPTQGSYKQLAAVLKDKLLPRCRFSVPSKNNRHDTFL